MALPSQADREASLGRLRAYIRFVDQNVPMIGAAAKLHTDVQQLDPDIETQRNLAVMTACDAIRAFALRDVYECNVVIQGMEASHGKRSEGQQSVTGKKGRDVPPTAAV